MGDIKHSGCGQVEIRGNSKLNGHGNAHKISYMFSIQKRGEIQHKIDIQLTMRQCSPSKLRNEHRERSAASHSPKLQDSERGNSRSTTQERSWQHQTSRQHPAQRKRPKDGFHIVHGPVATLTLSALHFPIKNEMESVQCAMDSDR